MATATRSALIAAGSSPVLQPHRPPRGHRLLASIIGSLALLLAALPVHDRAAAQSAVAQSAVAVASAGLPSAQSRAANSGTVGIVSGGADGTYVRIAADLANVLDGEHLRIMPMLGRGSLQNLRDIMFLRGIDIGIVQMDAREALRSDNLQKGAQERIRYIARLYNEEVHILASRDISDIRQLDGRKVNIDKAGSGTNLTARIIFEKLGIKPEFTTYDQAASYERLRSGEIQAAIYVAGRPVRAMSEFAGEGRFHLLSIPFEGELAETYLPARFTSSDYPKLIEPGRDVPTLAVGSVLAVFNWPRGSERYRRIERFVEAFFSRFDEFLAPGRHAKWKEVSLTATVPGWERSKPAQDWLDRHAGKAQQAGPDERKFQLFLDSRNSSTLPGSAEERRRLFREFIAWERAQERAQTRKRTGAAP